MVSREIIMGSWFSCETRMGSHGFHVVFSRLSRNAIIHYHGPFMVRTPAWLLLKDYYSYHTNVYYVIL